MKLAKPRNLVIDLLTLCVAWGGVGLVACSVGIDSPYHFLICSAFAIFFIPGWILSNYFRESCDSLPHRFFVAGLISFVIYGNVAFACYLSGWGFDAFYLLFAVTSVIALIAAYSAGHYDAAPHYGSLRPDLNTLLNALVLVLVVVLLAYYYRVPPANDLQLFMPNMVDHQALRSFETSSILESAFGLSESMPRNRAHLFHVFLALLGDAVGLNVVAVSIYLATIPLGLLMFASLYFFLRSVCGRGIPPICLVMALLAPISLFHRAADQLRSRHTVQVGDYQFMLFNSSVLDKNFALFFLLPALLFLTCAYLRSGRRRYLLLLLLSSVLTFYVHPVTGVYYLMSAPILIFAFGRVASRQARIAVGVYALALGVAVVAMKLGDQGQVWIDALAGHDWKTSRWPHFWLGQYLTVGVPSHGFEWVGDITGRDYLVFKRAHYLSPFIVTSFAATVLWAGVLFWRRRGPAHPKASGEAIAFRTQIGYLAVLAALYVGGQLLVNLRPGLYRGIERLHWFYFGFFAYAFVFYHLIRALDTQVAARLGNGWAGRAVMALPSLLVIAHLSGEIYTLRHPLQQRSRGLLFSSYATEYGDGARMAGWTQRRTQQAGKKRQLWVQPEWLRPDDKVFRSSFRDHIHRGYALGWVFAATGHALTPQLIYIPSLYHEAFAYQTYGEPFLEEFDAFHDGADERVTPRLVQWLERKRVTVLMSPNQKFVRSLADAMDRNATAIGQHTYRLEPRDS